MFSVSALLKRLSWHHVFPFLNWAPMVNRRTLHDDGIAALTGALVVLPQGVAFAAIAGMPPEYGLYAGMVPAIIAALFGSSWHLVSGPTTAASIVLASALGAMAVPESHDYVRLALTLAFMVGLIELGLGLFRLGTLVNFISHSVVIGFTAGAGILIGANQIKNFFGLDIPRNTSFYETLHYLGTHLNDIVLPVLAVGLVTLLSGLAVQRLKHVPVPVFTGGGTARWRSIDVPRIPYMIVAILAGTFFSVILNQYYGAGIPTVKPLPASLPPLSAPSFDWETWRKLASTALAVTLFALTEAVSISRALAVRSGQHIDANQEFIGQGLSNIAGSFFSGYVATGSFNRSGVNYTSGAKTPLAAVFAALLLMVVVLLVAPLAVYLPNAAMAGVLFLVAWGLIDWHHIHQIWRSSYRETGVMMATFLSTLFLELEQAIFIGVFLSLVIYLYQTSHPEIHRRVPDPQTGNRKFTDATDVLPECPQLRIIRVDGSLFFGAVNAFSDKLLEYRKNNPETKYLAIIMSGVNFIDIAGAEALASMARRWRDNGGQLYLIRPKERVVEFLERGGYIDEIGRANIFDSKTTALRTIYRRLDYDVCRACGLHVFVECSRLGKQEPEDLEPAESGN